MILNESQLAEIAGGLLHQTAENRLPWYRENGSVFVALPNQTTVELEGDADGPDVVIRVKGPSGIVYGEARCPKSPDSHVGKLYQAASEQAAMSIFREIMDSIQFSHSATAEVDAPAVPRVTPEQCAHVLERMAGRWTLEFARGRGQVTINRNGDYFIRERDQPTFLLKVLAWNEETSTAEVAKDKADGRRRQIEQLKITRDAMVGCAKHDGHKLRYTRLAD